HETLGAQLARDRAEDAGGDGFQLGVEQHGGIASEPDQGTVLAAHALGGAPHHGVVEFALLDAPAGSGVLDAYLADVADAGIAALGAAERVDARSGTCTRVVGHVQRGRHLDHDFACSNLTGSFSPARPRTWPAKPDRRFRSVLVPSGTR